MRKIRLKGSILEIMTERYLTPVQYSAFRQHPNRICKMMNAQSDETTDVKIGVVEAEDTSKMLTVTFAVKLPFPNENSFVNLNEVEQKLESFTEDVIGTINSWTEDKKMVITFIPGSSKLEAIKIIKESLHLGLKEAKDCVDAGQFECTEEQFKIIKPMLEKVGSSKFKKITVCDEEKSLDLANASFEECKNLLEQIAKRVAGIKNAAILVMLANKTQDGIGCHTFGDMSTGFAIMNLIQHNEAE